MNIGVYTIVLSSIDIKPVYKAIRNACKGFDLPMYKPLEGGAMNGCYYLIATPEDFKPDDMTNLLSNLVKNPTYEKIQMYEKTTVPQEHFNHNYEVSIRDTMGINLGKYTLTKVSPIYYGDNTTLQDTDEYKELFTS